MTAIRTENLNISYGNLDIVKDLNINIPKGKITTIIGANGCGKSTILKTIARIITPKSGDIYINETNIKEQSSKDLAKTMAVLPQSPQAPKGLTVEELIAYGRFPHQKGFGKLKKDDEDIITWALEVTGIKEFRHRPIEALSGGQRSKVLLTKLLLENPMILILDEPTNYLDEQHINWLINFLKNYDNAFILVSHDITFLNQVINVIYHLEDGILTRYKGDYNYYIQQIELKKRQQEASYQKQQKEIADLEDFIARNKARVATRNMASSRQKKLDKMDLIAKPKEKIKPTFSFLEARTPGKVLFECKDLVIGYNSPLTKPMNIIFERNKKIAIKGVNGLGKTTLLKTLIGMQTPYSGIVEKDPYVEIGFFKQEEAAINKTALEYIWDEFPDRNNGEIRSMLAKCGLTTEHIQSLMKVLSGGENAKVRLCKIMNREANILVLDEPTNHLDVDAKASLQTAIKAFKGAVILVSHEPEFYLPIVDEVINLEECSTKII